MKKDTVKLIKMAFITSPLLAIYNIAPISLMLTSGLIQPRLPLLLDSRDPKIFLFPVTLVTVNTLAIWLVNIWLVDKTNKNELKPILRYFFSFVFSFLLVFILTEIGSQLKPFPEAGDEFRRFYAFVGMAANNTVILIIIDLILNREKKAILEIEKANLESANLKSRHELLKQQIQPHFLFNALNTLKILISKDQRLAESYILKLSSFLRASISEGMEEKVHVKKDLEIFNDFMELQRIRFPGAIEYHNTISNELLHNYFLPTLTMQTLAENAIKHNEFSAAKPLVIDIKEAGGLISFSNNYTPKMIGLEGVGIGLKNLSERFKILSGRGIEIENDTKSFVVKFKIIGE